MTIKKSNNYYSTRYKHHDGRQRVWKAIVEDLEKRFILDASTVVDFGCGYGDFINAVKSPSRSAVDITDVTEYLDPAVNFYQKNLKTLDGFTDNSFSIAFSSNLLEHFIYEEAHNLVSEIYRVLKPKGRIILLQPNFRLCSKTYFDDYTHRTVFTDESLKGLLEAKGFKVIYRKPGYLPFSMTGILPKSYWLTKLFLSLSSPLLGKQMLLVGEKL